MKTLNTCFVIGPMNEGHMPTLKWLAKEVVRPFLEPKGLGVETPDSAAIGNIMDQVIMSCDRAPLVVADTTGNNPNVLYEMAILDAMGRACIPVKITGTDAAAQDRDLGTTREVNKDPMAFDRAAYRYFTLHRADTAGAKEIMEKAINAAFEISESGKMFWNPLTNFFGVPLSSFSSAYALARGYYLNLIKPAVAGLTNGKLLDRNLTDEQLGEVQIDCVIPDELDKASRKTVEDLLKKKRIEPVTIKAFGREVRLYAWAGTGPGTARPLRLMDIPTTMISLIQTVQGRLGQAAAKNIQPTSDEYRAIQENEISQFERYLKGFIASEADAQDIRDRVVVTRWANSSLA